MAGMKAALTLISADRGEFRAQRDKKICCWRQEPREGALEIGPPHTLLLESESPRKETAHPRSAAPLPPPGLSEPKGGTPLLHSQKLVGLIFNLLREM